MGTWRAPNRIVWHTVICPRCRKTARVKLPGLFREVVPRLCEECSAKEAAPSHRRERPRRGSPVPS